jgi:hypothetical protein
MDEGLDSLVEELGAALAAPDLPRLERNQPGLDKKWKAGDIALRVPPSQMELVAAKVGVSLGQLRSYADVARAYPPSERTVKAAWTIYREVRSASPDDRMRILCDGLTLRQARIAVGKGPMDRPKKERETDEERAWFVLEELQQPGIKAIVEREVRDATVARRTRKAAKTALDEIVAAKKFIDAELRKQQKQGTPEHQYLTHSKALIEAEQHIYSVARLHDRHAGAMTEGRWTDIVMKLRNVSASAEDVAREVEGSAPVDFIEGEEVLAVLELPPGDRGIIDAQVVGDE